MLCLDDDFVFYRHTDLVPVHRILETHPEIDLVAGEVVYLPAAHRSRLFANAGIPHRGPAYFPAGDRRRRLSSAFESP